MTSWVLFGRIIARPGLANRIDLNQLDESCKERTSNDKKLRELRCRFAERVVFTWKSKLRIGAGLEASSWHYALIDAKRVGLLNLSSLTVHTPHGHTSVSNVRIAGIWTLIERLLQPSSDVVQFMDAFL